MAKDTTAIIISKATDADRDEIFRLLEQANMHYIPSAEMPQLTYSNYFTAKIQSRVVGFCGYRILSSTEAKTELMVVDQSFRGRNIGYQLQVRRMEDMLSKGIRYLTTNTDAPDTIAWYMKKFGYRKIGTLNKIHEFGDPSIDHWTTLQVDMEEWSRQRTSASEKKLEM